MTTEELKREMYRWLAQVKIIDQGGGYQINSATNLENALEDYLEELRKDLSFACKSVDLADAKARKAAEEREQLRNKLQAFEFANKSAGELLIHAQETIRKQRQFIRTLYTSRKARKGKGSTSAQSVAENVSGEASGGNAGGICNACDLFIEFQARFKKA